MKIGKLEIDNNIFLAPMAGVTDSSYRKICRKKNAGLLYTEMVSAKGLYYGDMRTEEIMKVDKDEQPIALQIFGSDSEIIKSVIYDKLNNRDEFALIDINMGCPAPKIVKNGDGSALMKNPELIREIVKAAKSVSIKPITVKIRKGWDDNLLNALEIAKIIEESGADAITIHGRTREEFYTGLADWDIIKAIKENLEIPVIGNGDIFAPEDIKSMIEYTKCDAVMIGRGAKGNPWIFDMGWNYLKNGLYTMPTAIEKIDMCLEHLDYLTKDKKERIGSMEIRKHIAWYLKGLRSSSEIRDRINRATDRKSIREILLNYKDTYLNI
ncbi:MAG: tRNA dihydrouridine synthase DusB [Andreesenia angusta]|nr:tRNA dihydrouridine synthase DusB [Andreesenia angusta]